MKIGDRISLDIANNKKIIESIINEQGYAKDINQLAITYFCKDDNGTKYEIVQFWNSRNMVSICAGSN